MGKSKIFTVFLNLIIAGGGYLYWTRDIRRTYLVAAVYCFLVLFYGVGNAYIELRGIWVVFLAILIGAYLLYLISPFRMKVKDRPPVPRYHYFILFCIGTGLVILNDIRKDVVINFVSYAVSGYGT